MPLSLQPPSPAPPAMPPSPLVARLGQVDPPSEDGEAVAEQTMEIQAQQRAAASNSGQMQEQDDVARQRDNDRDWMLRDYQARLKKQGLAQGIDTSSAALPADSNSPTDPATAETGPASETDSLHRAKPMEATSHPDAANKLEALNMPGTGFLKPLLTPLLSTDADKNARDALSANADPSASVDRAVFAAPTPDHPTDPSSLDVPGLTAAQDGMSSSGMSLQDPLPDDTATGNSRNVFNGNNFTAPTAPSSDITSFFKRQNEILHPLGAPTAMQAPTVTSRPPMPSPAEPMAKPSYTGLRTHVDDPLDYLNR